MEIYKTLKEAGCELDNHESDLYVKATPQAHELIKAALRAGEVCSLSQFRSEKDGELWIEIPFAFSPWWEKRRGK